MNTDITVTSSEIVESLQRADRTLRAALRLLDGSTEEQIDDGFDPVRHQTEIEYVAGRIVSALTARTPLDSDPAPLTADLEEHDERLRHAIVELLGHHVAAGAFREQVIAGRKGVSVGGAWCPAETIYRVTWVTREQADAFATHLRNRGVPASVSGWLATEERADRYDRLRALVTTHGDAPPVADPAVATALAAYLPPQLVLELGQALPPASPLVTWVHQLLRRASEAQAVVREAAENPPLVRIGIGDAARLDWLIDKYGSAEEVIAKAERRPPGKYDDDLAQYLSLLGRPDLADRCQSPLF